MQPPRSHSLFSEFLDFRVDPAGEGRGMFRCMDYCRFEYAYTSIVIRILTLMIFDEDINNLKIMPNSLRILDTTEIPYSCQGCSPLNRRSLTSKIKSKIL